MSALKRQLLDVDTVAGATGLTPKTIRNWLERGFIEPKADGTGNRRLFSAYDLAILALVRPLVEFGTPVRAAVRVATATIDKSPGAKIARRKADLSTEHFQALNSSTFLRLHFRNGELVFDVSDDAGSAVKTFLQIDVSAVVEDAFRRAGIVPTSSGRT